MLVRIQKNNGVRQDECGVLAPKNSIAAGLEKQPREGLHDALDQLRFAGQAKGLKEVAQRLVDASLLPLE